MLSRLLAAAVLAVSAFAVAGCGADEPEQRTYTADNGDRYNDTDVAFATDMIPHHAQALQLVDLTVGRRLDPELRALTERILQTQGVEIEKMVTWLNAWERPIPETARDHVNSHGGGDLDHHSDLPGMLTEEELAELGAARGEDFRRLWLELMIKHHQGAVEMARTERSEGLFKGAVNLARSIERSQTEEIDLMEGLLRP